jgi:ATP-binding cassette subfamily G (WHITE) protein 2
VAPPRCCCAGPSGSGKTTLLNALACRLDKNTAMRGELRLNGQKYSLHELKQHAGYVMQDDMLNGNLTVLETLQYTAELRLPRSMTAAERREHVDAVLAQMGLTRVRDVICFQRLNTHSSGDMTRHGGRGRRLSYTLSPKLTQNVPLLLPSKL